jgi:N-acetyl-alpha-D-muramate 1-phosphate uridylyltransferase
MTDILAGIVLAAGGGTRLSPLTRVRPKALCPVGDVPLVDRSLRLLSDVLGVVSADRVAVNLHHGRAALEDHLAGRVHLSPEDTLLGTAGAIGRLRSWISGRDVVVLHADHVSGVDLAAAIDTWDREAVRLVAAGAPPDLDPDLRLCAALMPWWAIRDVEAEPSGLFRTVWAPAATRGALQVHGVGDVPWFDCGTPRSYLDANLWTNGGATVVGAGAQVAGVAERSVLWPGTEVGPSERLVAAIRATDRLTVLVR